MQGFNKYYPPDWVPDAGSLNKFHGKHALGDRARKLDKGILIVRFEMPFNIWCDGCNNHIGMGVRYNAEKSKVGMYYTTPILNFRCKCHLCQNWFEIRTDPQNTRYVVHSGARQKNEDWDPAENGTIVFEEKADEAPDAFAALEKNVGQKKRALSAAAHLDALESLSSSRWSDPYAASMALRSAFRKEKKVRVESEGRAEKTRERYGLGERVRVEDLRTPGLELRKVEDEEWERAKKEREMREAVSLGKRKREIAQLGWQEPSIITASRSTTTSRWDDDHTHRSSRRSTTRPSSSRASASSRPTASSRPSSISHPSIGPTSAKSPSSAVKDLASRLRLTSALKADPFVGDSRKDKSRSLGVDLGGSVAFRKRQSAPP